MKISLLIFVKALLFLVSCSDQKKPNETNQVEKTVTTVSVAQQFENKLLQLKVDQTRTVRQLVEKNAGEKFTVLAFLEGSFHDQHKKEAFLTAIETHYPDRFERVMFEALQTDIGGRKEGSFISTYTETDQLKAIYPQFAQIIYLINQSGKVVGTLDVSSPVIEVLDQASKMLPDASIFGEVDKYFRDKGFRSNLLRKGLIEGPDSPIFEEGKFRDVFLKTLKLNGMSLIQEIIDVVEKESLSKERLEELDTLVNELKKDIEFSSSDTYKASYLIRLKIWEQSGSIEHLDSVNWALIFVVFELEKELAQSNRKMIANFIKNKDPNFFYVLEGLNVVQKLVELDGVKHASESINRDLKTVYEELNSTSDEVANYWNQHPEYGNLIRNIFPNNQLNLYQLTKEEDLDPLADYSDEEVKKMQEIVLSIPVGNDKTIKDIATVNQENSNKLTIIDFWATWCYPCILKMGEMIQLQRDFKDMGIKFVFVNVSDEEDSKIDAFFTQNPHLKDFQDNAIFVSKGKQIAKDLEVRGIPSIFSIDGTGNLFHAKGRPEIVELYELVLTELSSMENPPYAYQLLTDQNFTNSQIDLYISSPEKLSDSKKKAIESFAAKMPRESIKKLTEESWSKLTSKEGMSKKTAIHLSPLFYGLNRSYWETLYFETQGFIFYRSEKYEEAYGKLSKMHPPYQDDSHLAVGLELEKDPARINGSMLLALTLNKILGSERLENSEETTKRLRAYRALYNGINRILARMNERTRRAIINDTILTMFKELKFR